MYQRHSGHENNAQITLGKAEKLQRAILKMEDDQTVPVTGQITSPSGEEDEKERTGGEEKGDVVLLLHLPVLKRYALVADEASKGSDSQLNIVSKSRLSRSSKSSKQKQGIEKSKSIAHEPVSARKSHDVVETEKVVNKKSIYLKVAEFLLKYNMATV